MSATEVFQGYRPLLFSIAYRMLGEVHAAEDAVQESFVRWQGADADAVRDPKAFLTSVTVNVCLDQLKSARARRETYVGPWLPEPLLTPGEGDSGRGDDALEEHESISMAFLVLLESLSPAERAAFLLHDVFDYDHREVARVLGREEAAVRQLVHRAREHVRARRPRFERTPGDHLRLLQGFVQACATGDVGALAGILADDVTLWSDGGGRARAALKPVQGADRVSRFLVGVAKKAAVDAALELVRVNGAPAVLVRVGEKPYVVVTLEADRGRIRELRLVLNPEKLAALS